MNSSFLIDEPCGCKGRWREISAIPTPYFEIGCGKGHITRCAEAFHGRNFIAIEGQSNVALRALQKAEENALRTCAYLSYVDDLRDFFAEGELSGIFLNFSDPWPKARHAKRRLTYRRRLLNYKEVLAPGSFVEFKSDNDGLFEFTLEEIEEAGLEIFEMTRDLHGDAEMGGCESGERRAATASRREPVITTEYEDRFREKGKI
ncbi:MAG: tRNA (guanosine(46)-N7)-methyltransferase TrmB [Anaerovoracaceae bacterium]